MTDFDTAQLREACRVFMDLAYPDGPLTMPLKKRAYYDMDAHLPLADYLPPSPRAGGIAQDLATRRGGATGFEFRLGSARFQHLKLRVQRMEHQGGSVWVLSVDTHDAYSPPPDDPHADRWLALKDANRLLKDQIEDALEEAGFLTFKSLLRVDLESPVG
jgi:hypothetical protein